MKPRKWLPWMGAALLTVVVGGMGVVSFHQLRIRSLLRDLRADVESYRPPQLRNTARVIELLASLKSHGCRALPALVDDLHPEAPSAYLEALGTILLSILDDLSNHDDNPETRYQALDILRSLEITWRDPPAEVRRKCEGIRRWWAEEGHRYHDPWRFWSTDCRAP